MPSLDLIVRNAVLRGSVARADIGVSGGRIVAIEAQLDAEAARSVDAGGKLLLPGFVDTHVHLDKACILDRCAHADGSLTDAIRAVGAMKSSFTVEDVYARGASVLRRAIGFGTTHMRTHVEVDPRAGLRSFEAVKRLKRDFAWGLDLSICVFPQEGLTNDPGTEELLAQALGEGADLLGGCPYTDTDPHAQIARLFALAKKFDVDLDLHLDFDLDPTWNNFDELCRQTQAHGYGGRVAAGHMSKISAMEPAAQRAATARLRDAGVAITVLPATDIYLMGRDASHNIARGMTTAHRLAADGVTASIATNNVQNPFTPFGDASLLRMANFYAHVAQAGPSEFEACLDLVTDSAAKLMNVEDYGIAVGNSADLILIDAPDATHALAALPDVLMGFKRGRQSFSRKPVMLHNP